MACQTTSCNIVRLGSEEDQSLRFYLRELCFAVGARDALIADLSGHLWLSSGPGGEYDQETFTVLLATGMGAAVEMMNVLDDSQGTSVFLHEGARFIFASAHIDRDIVLALIFEQGRAHSRVGSVYFYLKRAVAELRQVLTGRGAPSGTALAQQVDQGFSADAAETPCQLAFAARSGLNFSTTVGEAPVGAPTLLSYQEALSLGLVNLDQPAP